MEFQLDFDSKRPKLVRIFNFLGQNRCALDDIIFFIIMLVLSNIVRLVLQNLSVEGKELRKADEEDDECLNAEQGRLLRGNSGY